MRQPRLKSTAHPSFYHCLSRVTDGQALFATTGPGAEEAERFVSLLHGLAAFCGISLLTYALMSNHFHLLCEVPEPRPLSDPELLDRVEALYGPARRAAAQRVLEGQTPGGELARVTTRPCARLWTEGMQDRIRAQSDLSLCAPVDLSLPAHSRFYDDLTLQPGVIRMEKSGTTGNPPGLLACTPAVRRRETGVLDRAHFSIR